MVRTKGKNVKRKRANRTLTLLAMIAFAIVPACFNDSFAAQKAARRIKPHTTKHAARVIELRDIEQLQAAFQRDAGKIRLAMILSPT
jgi:hypothetical protein